MTGPPPSATVLTDADVERLADALAPRLAALLGPAPSPLRQPLVDAREVARRFAVSLDFIYDNADSLGVVRLGGGQRPRLRFDLDRVAEALTACSVSKGSEPRRGRRKAKARAVSTANGQNGPRFLPERPQ